MSLFDSIMGGADPTGANPLKSLNASSAANAFGPSQVNAVTGSFFTSQPDDYLHPTGFNQGISLSGGISATALLAIGAAFVGVVYMVRK